MTAADADSVTLPASAPMGVADVRVIEPTAMVTRDARIQRRRFIGASFPAECAP